MRPGDAALVDDLLNPKAARRAVLAALLDDLPGVTRMERRDVRVAADMFGPGGALKAAPVYVQYVMTVDDVLGLLDALADAREA